MRIKLRLMPYEPKSILPRLWRRGGKPILLHSKMQFTARKYNKDNFHTENNIPLYAKSPVNKYPLLFSQKHK